MHCDHTTRCYTLHLTVTVPSLSHTTMATDQHGPPVPSMEPELLLTPKERKVSPRSVIFPSSEEDLSSSKMKLVETKSRPPRKDGFDEEPFDCATDLKRKNLMAENLPRSRNHNKIPMQAPKRIIVPKSPLSVSSQHRASSFRLRRMQLAQQRKWKEEYIERTVHSKSMMRDSDDERTIGSHSQKSKRDIDLGKEVFISHEEGLEMSISNQLQKSGFDSSLIPVADRYDFSMTNKIPDLYGNANDDRSIAMDTVSSLNSSHYASDDGLSLKDSKTVNSRRVRRERKLKKERAQNNTRETEDSLHPPLFVSSVQKVRKDDPIFSSKYTDRTGVNYTHDEPYINIDESEKRNEEMISRNISVMSPFNTSTANANKSANPLDKTAVVSNKVKHVLNQVYHDEKENDIPWFKPKYKNIGSRKEAMRDVSRERPINSQLFQQNSNSIKSPEGQPPSLSNAKSPTILRRRRLQLYLKNDEIENDFEEGGQSTPVTDVDGVNLSNDSSNKSDPYDKVGEPGISHDNCVKNETMSVKSYKSSQTFATLHTCMTIEPSSPEQMERFLKRKQRMIFLIHHALTCTHPHATDPDDESYIPCPEVTVRQNSVASFFTLMCLAYIKSSRDSSSYLNSSALSSFVCISEALPNLHNY